MRQSALACVDAAMLLRVEAFAALSKQLRGDFASDERLGGRGGRASGIKKKRFILVHRVSLEAAARRSSEEAGGWI